jgi:hypothetical protein
MATPEPLSIVGIDAPHVGAPRNDGTPGSALYAVPIKLSRRPSAREAEWLVQHWDRPPPFSTMHRRGIAYMASDCLVLDGTTVEEVRDYHAKTLSLVVAAVNASEAAASARDAAERVAAAERLDAHHQNVTDVASSVRFD